MKKIYIAGPMRGLPNGNLPAFDRATVLWQSHGWLVMSPAALVRALGYIQTAELEATELGDDFHNCNRAHLNHVFQIDFACIFAADAIALLLGWERSMGATAELALAQVLGLETYDAETMEQLQPKQKPWSLLPTKPSVEPPNRIRFLRQMLDGCFCDDYGRPQCPQCEKFRLELYKLEIKGRP